MDYTDVLIQTDNVLTVFAQGVQASLLTPEQREELRWKLHNLIETNLKEDLFLRPFTDQDPAFHWTDQDGVVKRMFIRWDGVFMEISGDRVARVADPFDLNVSLRRSNTVMRLTAENGQISIEPLQELVPYGDGVSDMVVIRIALYSSSDRESSQKSSEVHYALFSRVDLLMKLEEVLPTIGRLVLTKVEPDEFGLAIQYHHNPRKHRELPGGLILLGQDVFEAVGLMAGKVLADNMLVATHT